jgi:protein-S-isoprenylcysteine O-methyltransferase Ste14
VSTGPLDRFLLCIITKKPHCPLPTSANWVGRPTDSYRILPANQVARQNSWVSVGRPRPRGKCVIFGPGYPTEQCRNAAGSGFQLELNFSAVQHPIRGLPGYRTIFGYVRGIPMALYAIIAENIWWVCLVIYLILRMPHRRRARREPISISKEDLLELVARKFAQICLGIFPLIYIITKFPSFANYPFFPPLLVIGTAAIAAALWCIFRAHHDLGRAFSVTLELREKHPLVTVGIYQYVRHPMYLGFLLWALAQALLLPNWIVGVMGFVGWIAIFGTRVRREEGMMLQQFGEEYQAYMDRTARLIPWVF